MPEKLDFPIAQLPRSLHHSFEYVDLKNIFLYQACVDKIELCPIGSIYCRIKISKKRALSNQLIWKLWKSVWSFSQEKVDIVNWNGKISKNHRNSLTTQAINAGILLTELLLDRLFREIESKLETEHARIMSRCKDNVQDKTDQSSNQ